MGLAWDSSPVASQHSYGGLTSGLPVSSLLWLGSESYFICNELWSAIQSVPKSKNPSNNSGGLGSWREQQQTNEANQKLACRLTRPPQVSEGLTNPLLSSDATQTIWIIHKTKKCQEVFSNKLIICDFICCFSAKQTNSLVVHRGILRLSEDAFGVSNVKRG